MRRRFLDSKLGPYRLDNCVASADTIQMGKEHFKLMAKYFGKSIYES